MSTQLKCPQCGTALPPGALEGLCPACLLKQGATSDSATQGGPAPFEALPVPEVAKLFPQLLGRVLARLREEYVVSAKLAVFEQLKPFITMGKSAIPYLQAADALGITEAAARVTVHRLRRRYRELLRDEVAQTLSHPDQVEEEMRALLAAFVD